MKKLFVLLLFWIFSFSALCFAQIKKQQEFYPDDPSEREEYEFMRLRDPKTNEIPPLIAQKEFEFASKLPKHNPFGGKLNSPLASDWQPAGPANQSGRVQAVGIDILNEDNMLAGTASGGVWRSIDAGQSWVKVTLPNDEQSISAIVQDTRKGKESTWYYSTGELLSTTGRRITSDLRTHSWGNGIYRSTNNGATWDPIASTVTAGTNTAPVNFTGIWNLALDNKDTLHDVIYAACYGGIMRSSDGGITWTNVLGDDSAKCFNSEIVIGSGGTLYAAIGSVYDGTATPHQGVWRSTDGIQWTNIAEKVLPTLVRRFRLALSASTDSILYCITEAPENWSGADTSFLTTNVLLKYSYHSGDGSGASGTWESRIVPYDYDPYSYYGSLGGYALVLAVHPDDPNQVFVGGTNLYYSSNGFQTPSDFIEIGGYPYNMEPGTLHPDMHIMVFSRSNHSKIFVGNDGGVSELDDYNGDDNSWVDYNNGLSSAQVYHSSLDHGTVGDNLIVSGLQDNNSYETQSSSPSDPWYVLDGGDGMTTGIVPGGQQFFASWQDGNIDCFFNDGQNLNYAGVLPPPSQDAIPTFFSNYILEPNQGNELYQPQMDHLWRYNNVSQIPNEAGNINSDWTELPEVYDSLNSLDAFITAFGFATDIRDRLFFGTNIGKVYEIDNAASNSRAMKNISGSEFPQNGFVAGIEVDPNNANEIIVVFSNYHVQSLFHTTDGGKTWDAIGGNLEELPDGAGSGPSVRCAKILHISSGVMYYVGTSVGLYSTTRIDGMKTIWTQEAPTTIGNLIVESLDARQSDGRIIASTQGGGVFRNTITNGVKSQISSTQQYLQVEQNYPNPFVDATTLRFTLSKESNVRIDLYNALGEDIAELANTIFEAGSHTIELSAKKYPSGNYFVHITAGNNVVTKMITVVK